MKLTEAQKLAILTWNGDTDRLLRFIETLMQSAYLRGGIDTLSELRDARKEIANEHTAKLLPQEIQT